MENTSQVSNNQFKKGTFQGTVFINYRLACMYTNDRVIFTWVNYILPKYY